MKTFYIYILPLFLLFSVCIWADATASVFADPTAVRIGDRIKLTLNIEYPESAKVGILARSDSMLGAFNIVSISLDSAVSTDSMLLRRLKYELTYFGLADNFIPPVGVVIEYPDGTVDTLMTQPIRVSFRSMLGSVDIDSADICDVKPPKAMPFNYGKFALNLFWGVLIAAVILGYLWIRSRKERGLAIFEFIAPKKSPWELALLKLDALAESELLAKGEFKEYFDQLTDILREYIEGRFGITAMELSTTETMQNLRQAQLGIDTLLAASFMDSTEQLLRRADLIKFAKVRPDIQTALEDWKLIRKLVEETAPKPEPEERKPMMSSAQKEADKNTAHTA